MKTNEKMMEKFKNCDFKNIKQHEQEYMKRVRDQFQRTTSRKRSKTE